MPRSSSLAKNILHVSEEVMGAVGLMLKELLINPTLDYFEATDPKTTHEVKKFFKDTTTATKKWFDSLTLPTQQTIKDLLRLTDVVGTASIVKGSLKSVTTAKSNTAAKPFLNTKIKATLTKAELEALKHIENLKNYLQDIEIPTLATAEGIPLNKIPKDSCPNINKLLNENKNILLNEIKNPNKIKITSNTKLGDTTKTKVPTKYPTVPHAKFLDDQLFNKLYKEGKITYKDSPKHHINVRGDISHAPKNSKVIKDSIAIKETSNARVAVDPKNDQIVMFRLTQHNPHGIFEYHGYTSSWKDLSHEARRVLQKNRLVTQKGRIEK